MLFRRIAVAAALAVGLGVLWLALGHDPAARITLTDAQAAPIAGTEGAVAVFVAIANEGPADRLLGADAPGADRVVLEAPDETIPVPARQTVSLATDAALLRLEGVAGSVEHGQLLPLTLHFERAGPVATKARYADPTVPGLAAAHGLFGLGDICVVGEGEPAPELALSVTPEADGWLVQVETRDFVFVRDESGVHVPGEGHGHLYVGGAKVGRLYGPEARIGTLPPGTHRVTVTLNTNDHRAYVVGETAVTAEARIVQP